MKTNKSYNFAIIGLGMVGTAIGLLLKKSGHKITAISDKSPVALRKALLIIGSQAFRNPRQAVKGADCVVITVPDDAILSACNEIGHTELLKEKLVFHMSGAGGIDLLDAAKRAGAITASIHPMQSFSSIENAVHNIPGSFFGITADKNAKKRAREIVRDLRGILFSFLLSRNHCITPPLAWLPITWFRYYMLSNRFITPSV